VDLQGAASAATTAASAAATSTFEATAQKLQPMTEAVADGLNPVVQQLTDPRNYEAAAESLSSGACAVGSKLVELDEQTGASTQLKRLGDALNEHVVPALNEHVIPHVGTKIAQFDEHTGASAQLTKLEASLAATVTTAAPHLEKGLDSLLNLAATVAGMAVRTRPICRGSTVETPSGASVETSSGTSVETSSGACVETPSGSSIQTRSGSTVEIPSRFRPAPTQEPAAVETPAPVVEEPVPAAQVPAATDEPTPTEQPVAATEEPVPMSESFVAPMGPEIVVAQRPGSLSERFAQNREALEEAQEQVAEIQSENCRMLQDLVRVRDAEMTQLKEMGFLDDDTNRVALDKADGNITVAVDILTGCDGFTLV